MTITATELDNLIDAGHEAAENDDSGEYNPFNDYGSISIM